MDAVIAYHQDRLTRRPMEWEQFVELCDRAGVEQLATVTSDIDFGNDNGMLVARITAAVAANESARKSERIKRKIQQNVERASRTAATSARSGMNRTSSPSGNPRRRSSASSPRGSSQASRCGPW